MQSKQLKSVIVSNSEGKEWHVFGQTVIGKVMTDDTNGAYSVFEQLSPPQSGPPVHIHRSEDEMIYILEGDLEIQWGDQIRMGTKGDLAFIPRNIPHTFKNIGTVPSKVLVMIMPGGFEGFFEELNHLPTDEPPEVEKILRVAEKYNAEIIRTGGN